MHAVSLSELKAHLSRYIREVQRGGEVQSPYRGKPVARLCGVRGTGVADAQRRDRLIASGVLRAGSGDASCILRKPPLAIEADLAGAVEAERGDRV